MTGEEIHDLSELLLQAIGIEIKGREMTLTFEDYQRASRVFSMLHRQLEPIWETKRD